MNKITGLAFAKHQKKKLYLKAQNLFPSTEIFSKRRNIYVKSLSFISFNFYIFVMSPEDGRNSLPKYVACLKNKWLSKYLCCCIGLISNDDINLINTKGIALPKVFPFVHKVLNLT